MDFPYKSLYRLPPVTIVGLVGLRLYIMLILSVCQATDNEYALTCRHKIVQKPRKRGNSPPNLKTSSNQHRSPTPRKSTRSHFFPRRSENPSMPLTDEAKPTSNIWGGQVVCQADNAFVKLPRRPCYGFSRYNWHQNRPDVNRKSFPTPSRTQLMR